MQREEREAQSFAILGQLQRLECKRSPTFRPAPALLHFPIKKKLLIRLILRKRPTAECRHRGLFLRCFRSFLTRSLRKVSMKQVRNNWNRRKNRLQNSFSSLALSLSLSFSLALSLSLSLPRSLCLLGPQLSLRSRKTLGGRTPCWLLQTISFRCKSESGTELRARHT